MIEEGKVTSRNEMQLHHDLQTGIIEKEKEKLKGEVGMVLGQLQGVQDSLVS
jgi:hypothetical protein